MIQRVASGINNPLKAQILPSLHKTCFFSCPLVIQQTATAFSAWKKADNPTLLEKVTGWEENAERRKVITSQFKECGLKWDHAGKAWIPSNDISLDKVKEIIQSQPAATSNPGIDSGSFKTPYANRIDTLLEKWEKELTDVLPRGIHKQKFLQSLRSGLIASAKAGSATSDEALFIACTRCAQLGITPGPLNEGYFSTREDQIEFLIGYKGLISLARRAVPGLQVEANVVRKGDQFTYKLGTSPSVALEQVEDADADDILYAYVLIRFPDGTSKLSVIDQPHVQKRMACSRGAHAPSSPWKKFKREMWLKTAIREAFRFVNLSPEGQSQVDAEAAIKTLKEAITALQSELEDRPGEKSGE